MNVSKLLDMHPPCLLQFRSISYGLFGTEAYHKAVRRKAIVYMREHQSDFEAFLGDDFDSWVKELSHNDSWGDELTLVRALTQPLSTGHLCMHLVC